MHEKSHSGLSVAHLKCEYAVNPLGLDVAEPRLSWELRSDARGAVQKAYRVRVAAFPRKLAADRLVWDSGRVASDQSIHVAYEGPALRSSQRCWWQVKVWDRQGRESAWSRPAFWEMGLLAASDWKAKWIGPAVADDPAPMQPCPMLRGEFEARGAVRNARVYVTGLGLYELEINGRRVGDQCFTPGWTAYYSRLQYQVYDVTGMIRPGKNAVGALLGDGWYRGHMIWDKSFGIYGKRLALLAQIRIEYEDGRVELIHTDKSWKSTLAGPVRSSDIYMGEMYDARREKKGWSLPGYSGRNWKGVRTTSLKVLGLPETRIVASAGVPVRRTGEVKPVQIVKTPAGETVFDMGQNMVGWVRIKVRGKAGAKVVLRHAEVLDRKGNFYTANIRLAQQRIEYVLRGGGVEQFEPHFTFQGFRYVKVEEFPGEPALDSLLGVVVHSDMRPTGYFKCSDKLVNQLQHNIQWGQKGNFLDVPTDCPQRDERMGWTGDAQVFTRTACFNMDTASFFTKWLADLALEQAADGSIPCVVPNVTDAHKPDRKKHVMGVAAWSDAGVICPWTIYLCYGDTRMLEQQFESMRKWVDYIKGQAGDSLIWRGGGFGDWLSHPSAITDIDVINTAFFAYSAGLVSKAAKVLGRKKEAAEYDSMHARVSAAFCREFVTLNGRVANNTQTAYLLALHCGLLPEGRRAEAARRLADNVTNHGHLTTGFVGTPYLCHELTKYGYNDLAYKLLNRREYPSWLYPVTKGATTIWERWDGIKTDDSFQDAGMNSFNHYAYGSIGDWMYSVVAGLNIDEKMPAYKHSIVRPMPGGGLKHAGARIATMYGRLACAWRLKGRVLEMHVVVPQNTTASVRIPRAKLPEVCEGGKPLSGASGISEARQNGADVVCEAGSGKYVFESKWRGA